MRWLIPIAGTILAIADRLTAWWGIALIVVLALVHFMDAFAGVDREARVAHGEFDVYGFIQFLVITLPMVAGLFIGNAAADAVGAAVGSVGAGLVGSAVFAVIYARTEQRISEREPF